MLHVYRHLWLASIGILTILLSMPAAADEFTVEPGFVSMFNGQDFSGWQFDQSYALPEKLPANWKVEDGLIKLSGGGRPHLGSQWDYEADFIFVAIVK